MREGETPLDSGAGGETDRPVRWRRAFVLFALGPLGVLATWLASFAPGVTDEVYSQRVFPAVRWTLLAVFAVSLPKSGPWMDGVKSILGIGLLVAALYFLAQAFPALGRYAGADLTFATLNGLLIVVG